MPAHSPILAPSLLAGDHARLGESTRLVEELGLSWIHLDIMDGHFVPNLTFGPGMVAALRPLVSLFFDVHLMLDNPHEYIEPFATAGANLISVHVEPEYDIESTLRRIRQLGCQNGIVLNPGTPVEEVEPWIGQVDLVLVMTVQPGFGGQSFRHEVLPKLETLAQWRERRQLNFRLEVDGGIDLATVPLCRQRGADTFVAGTAFYRAEDRAGFLKSFDQLTARGSDVRPA